MKTLFITAFITLFLFVNTDSNGQVNQWTWLHGSNTANAAQSLGVQGVPSASNVPPAVYEPCQWSDTTGNLWLFGGKTTTGNFYGDLWKYNPLVNEWTWMKGSGTGSDPGNYGAQGVPSPNNYPPCNGFGVPTWVDKNNNLWMYGGAGGAGSNMDDLWKYDISTNEWTWMKGDDSSMARGVYGRMGVPDIANEPGFRCETAAAWTDDNNDLWLFGGAGYNGTMNDLWRYDIAHNTWTWMNGSSQGFQAGIYGTKGIEDSLNIPSGRYIYSHWKDRSGNFWIFGGYDGHSSINCFNDIWRYNPTTNNWTWMSGSNLDSLQGFYVDKCLFDSANVPYSRWENRSCWTDKNGDFCLWGGGTAGSGGFSATFNDLWKYCVSSNQWYWVSGDSIMNPAGSWGSKGVSSPSNKPNGRAGAVGWSAGQDFYVFGGTLAPFGQMYNDLWRYTVDSTCGACSEIPLDEKNLSYPEKEGFTIYPNPANDELYITGTTKPGNAMVTVFNTLGKKILVQKMKLINRAVINIEDLSSGIYFLQVLNESGTWEGRFVKR